MYQPPIRTVGQPTAALAPQRQTSVVRIAGLPQINTVVLPIINGEDVRCGVLGVGTIAQVCISPITAAGIPPIITVAAPGPVITPPCVVKSPNLAAADIIIYLLINLYQRSFYCRDARRRNFGICFA